MKITADQTERLYQFTREHYVEYYDLQTELVDHLANGIELLWSENPKLSFEEAMQMEFKKFGIFGFMNVVEQRQTTLTKKYNGLVWHHFKAFFQLPRIIATITAIVLLKWILGTVAFTKLLAVTLFGLLFLIYLGGLCCQIYKNRKKVKTTGKKWLFEEILAKTGSIMAFGYLPMQVIGQLLDHTENTYVVWIISFVIVAQFLLNYIMLHEIPKKSQEYLMATYPEYKLT
ncbi:MAG TPA: hypothetical protein VLB74_07730 [Flavobacterium sp.]|uniref:hypothetical protein n=1 Tax=Flavobacterium sp. TaxID=239 RepID=UPI002BC39754|nr:hypothetical protein [Flavobacterium sp.]HSD14522.1 hypothetical protein [Flavobacterium sp.]